MRECGMPEGDAWSAGMILANRVAYIPLTMPASDYFDMVEVTMSVLAT